jgi:formate dehydrogenase subunit gamma
MANQNTVVASSPFERIVHWLLALSCLALFLTGLGLMFKSWTWIPAFFGGTARLKTVHDLSAWVFMVSLVLSIVVWAKDCLVFDGDDAKWLSNLGGYLSSKPVHFEVGKFNAGQKIFYLVTIIGGILISLSGLALMYPDSFSRSTVQLSGAIHVLTMTIMGIFIVAHIYLGTIGNPGTVSVMFSGKVSRAWARTHRSKWLKKQESGA